MTRLDPRLLEQLTDDLGDVDEVRALAADFLAQLGARVDDALQAGDPEAARRAAHSLKSTARLVGLLELSEAARAVELTPSDSARSTLSSAAEEGATALGLWLEERPA